MSHFSKIQTQIIDIEALIQALQELGYQDIAQGENLPVEGVGTMANAQLVVTGTFRSWSGAPLRRQFGFTKQADKTFSLGMDPWMLQADTMKNLSSQIQQRYATVIAKGSLIAQGFTLIEETLADGEVHLTLVRV